SGAEPALPPVGLQFGDFAAWQREWASGGAVAHQLAYWKKQLAGTPALELPTDARRPPALSFRGAEVQLTVPTQGLKELCKSEDVTPFMALLAAFQALLHRYSGQEDFCVGVPSAGRNRTELEGMIGFFTNMLAMRADLSGRPTFRQLLRRVRETALSAYSNQDAP